MIEAKGDETVKDGGPAFPVSDLGVHGNFGMSLRDHLAARLAPGCLEFWRTQRDGTQVAASEAYAMADALIKARGEGQ